MTIAAAYLTSDGVVLGADSLTSVITNDINCGQLLPNAQKVFEVGINSRVGLCTWGEGDFRGISHRTIVAQLADKITDDNTIEEISKQLKDIAEPLVKLRNIPFIGYFIGGCDAKTHEPNCYIVQLYNKQDAEITKMNIGQFIFGGVSYIVSRIYNGYDPNLRTNLKNKLRESLSGIDDFDNIFEKKFEEATAQSISNGYGDIPIRDAIDFVHFCIYATIKAEKFKNSIQTCGGDIEMGFITTDRRFRWAQHKPFYSAIIE